MDEQSPKASRGSAADRSTKMKELWANPEYRARQIASRAGKTKNSWLNLDIRARRIAGLKKAKTRPASRKNQAALTKASWRDPDARSKKIAGIKNSWSSLTPQERDKRISAAKSGQATPEARARLMEGIKQAWANPKLRAEQARRNQERGRDPKVRARRSAEMKRRWEKLNKLEELEESQVRHRAKPAARKRGAPKSAPSQTAWFSTGSEIETLISKGMGLIEARKQVANNRQYEYDSVTRYHRMYRRQANPTPDK